MLGKKLLTLGCVVGILLIGACFDIRRQMPFVHTVGVEVTGKNSCHEVLAAELRRSLVDSINGPQWRSHLHAIEAGGTDVTDATRTVSILDCFGKRNETTTWAGFENVSPHCSLSIALTRNRGTRTMWKAPNYQAFASFKRGPLPEGASTASEDEGRGKNAADEFASEITRDLFYSYVADW